MLKNTVRDHYEYVRLWVVSQSLANSVSYGRRGLRAS